MSTRNKAWLLVPYGAEPFAVAEHVVMEYLSATQPHAVPLTSPHCRAVLFWRNRIVPLLDFGVLAGPDRASAIPKAVVLAYQPEPGAPLIHIAVALREPPVRIVVDDGMACALPPENKMPWGLLATSCFARDGVATPIVSIARLDSAEFRLHVEANCAEASTDAAASTAPLITALAADDKLVMADPAGDNISGLKEVTARLDADTSSDIDDERNGDEDENLDDADDGLEDDEDFLDDNWADLEASDEDDPTLDLEEDAELDASAEWDEGENLDGVDDGFEDDEDLDGDDWMTMEASDEDCSTLDLEEDVDPSANAEWGKDEDEEIGDNSEEAARVTVDTVVLKPRRAA